MLPVFTISEEDLRQFPPLKNTDFRIIPRGWMELIYDFGLDLARFDQRHGTETKVMRFYECQQRLLVICRTTALAPLADEIFARCEELEVASRVTCSVCGRSGGRVARRAKHPFRTILCDHCR